MNGEVLVESWTTGDIVTVIAHGYALRCRTRRMIATTSPGRGVVGSLHVQYDVLEAVPLDAAQQATIEQQIVSPSTRQILLPDEVTNA